jgi:hypothetical protein
MYQHGATSDSAPVLGHTYSTSSTPPRPRYSGAAEEGIHQTLHHTLLQVYELQTTIPAELR